MSKLHAMLSVQPKHLQLVAHAVTVGVVDATITVVELSWEHAICISFCCFVVVASQWVVATCSRYWERQRHACSVERLLVDVTELDVDQRVWWCPDVVI